jgi:23S rRNA pseudouridine1911/1915/1917 synthase
MGQFNEIKIIYEDNHLLVVEKPPNMLTQSDSTGDADLLSVLKEDLKLRYNKPGEAYLGLVHRLDRPVGGVMVFAKTSKAASRLSEQIRNRTFKKNYYAVVHGMPEKSFGTYEDYLYKDEETNTVSVVTEESGKGKIARLDYEVLENWEGMSLVKINLHTGRSHQIRVQFANAGQPLFGDRKYGFTNNKIEQAV